MLACGGQFVCMLFFCWGIVDIWGFLNSSAIKKPPAGQETQEMQVPSLGWEDPLEMEMATHSSIPAWKIPGTEEPCGLNSKGSQSGTGQSEWAHSWHIWLPRWLSGKEFICNAGDLGLIPGSGRSPREGNSKLLQYSCLGNPMDRGALAGYSPWGHKEWDTTQQLNNKKLTYNIILISGVQHNDSVFLYILKWLPQ